MRDAARIGVALGLIALAATACSATETGSAAPAPVTGQTSTVSIPPVPQKLPLDSVQPCSLFTRTQVSQLGIQRVKPDDSRGNTFHALLCNLNGTKSGQVFGYGVFTVTTQGIAPWLSGQRNVDAKQVTVAGYPAADFRLAGTKIGCSTAVQVGDDQSLQIDWDLPFQGFTPDQYCQATEQAAGMALATLKTLK